MKKLFFLSVMAIGMAVVNAQGQGGNGNNGGQAANNEVTLKVVLKPFQTLTVNDNQKVVELVYDEAGKYVDGVDKEETTHLNVHSSGAYKVEVKRSAWTNTSGNGNDVLFNQQVANEVQIQSTGSDNVDITNQPTINLTEAGGVLFQGAHANGTVDVEYIGAKNNLYLPFADTVAGINATEVTYETTVTYTISPQ